MERGPNAEWFWSLPEGTSWESQKSSLGLSKGPSLSKQTTIQLHLAITSVLNFCEIVKLVLIRKGGPFTEHAIAVLMARRDWIRNETLIRTFGNPMKRKHGSRNT
jgi:hypothetical protein